MKKSAYVALTLGTLSGLMFAIGMCMALLPEWNAFVPGVILGGLGLILCLAAIVIWRRMERKEPIRLSRKTIFTIIVAVVSALILGFGMCLCMVWNKLVPGIVVGLIGIATGLCVIPLIQGLKE